MKGILLQPGIVNLGTKFYALSWNIRLDLVVGIKNNGVDSRIQFAGDMSSQRYSIQNPGMDETSNITSP